MIPKFAVVEFWFPNTFIYYNGYPICDNHRAKMTCASIIKFERNHHWDWPQKFQQKNWASTISCTREQKPIRQSNLKSYYYYYYYWGHWQQRCSSLIPERINTLQRSKCRPASFCLTVKHAAFNRSWMWAICGYWGQISNGLLSLHLPVASVKMNTNYQKTN